MAESGLKLLGRQGPQRSWRTERQWQRFERNESINREYQEIGKFGWIKPGDGKHGIFKPKDLVPIPWMVAMALQADGWWLRQEITWCKTNPMPESVRDRPTKATESIFLLSKGKHYFYDKDACLAPLAETSLPRAKRGVSASNKWLEGAPGSTAHSISRPRLNAKLRDSGYGGDGSGLRGHSGYYDAEGHLLVNPAGRNLWNYWVINTANWSGSHFAVFPEEIPRRAILLSTSEKGACPKCGKAWARVIERAGTGPQRKMRKHDQTRMNRLAGSEYQQWREEHPDTTLGWQPTCNCDVGEPVPCLILDPFIGAGTTGLVAEHLGRNWLGIELNPEYVKMALERIEADRKQRAQLSLL